jgi:hypothetical protein
MAVTWSLPVRREVEVQKRFGFTSDNIKIQATFATTFTDRGARRRAE